MHMQSKVAAARRVSGCAGVLLAALSLVTVCGLPRTVHAQQAGAGERAKAEFSLPMRSITLYRSGVASVERRGEVQGSGTVALSFQREQINDILKSLVVLDLSGGRVGEVSYPSQEPLERRMERLRVNLGDQPSIAGLLARLRGHRISFETGDRKLTGTIIGTENRPEGFGHLQQAVMVPFVNVLTDAGILSVNIMQARMITLEDTELQREFIQALTMLSEQGEDKRKPVSITLEGDGTRSIVAAYVQEAPVWKTSYRLVLPEEGSGPNCAGKPILQGWAIVENVSDEDWKGVELSLASGQPSAFRMDLETPLFTQRPTVDVPVPLALGAVVFSRDMLAMKSDSSAGVDSERRMRPRVEFQNGSGEGRDASAPASPAPSVRMGRGVSIAGARTSWEAGSSSVSAMASGLSAGESFFFRFDQPISIASQQSAMLPMISGPISARRVSILRQDEDRALRGAELTNDTGLQLIAGPVAVFDAGVYAGDAQIDDVSRGEKRLLAYAADTELLVQRNPPSSEALGSTRTIQRTSVARGVLTISSQVRYVSTYAARNLDSQRDRTLIIEQPRVHVNAALVEPAQAQTTSDGLYRFEMNVPKEGTANLRVVEQWTEGETYALTSVSKELFATYVASGKVSDQVKFVFQRIGELSGAKDQAVRRVASIRGELDEITKDQDRIRANLQAIDRSSDLAQRLLTKLGEQETRVEQLTTDLASARAAEDAAAKALSDFVATANAE